MKPPCLPKIYESVEFSASFCGLTSNFLLFFLVLYRTPKELSAYRRVLFCNLLNDAFFSFSTLFVNLHLSFRNGFIFYNIGGIFVTAPLEVRSMLMWFGIFECYITVNIIAIPFVYRYFAVCRNYRLSNVQFLSMIASEIALIGSAATVGFFMWQPLLEKRLPQYVSEAAQFPEKFTCVDEGEMPFFQLSDAATFPFAFVNLLFGGLVFSHYTVIAVCSYKIWKQIKKAEVSNPKIVAASRQLSITLGLQAITPPLVSLFPVFGSIVVLLSGHDTIVHQRILESAVPILSWLPTLNACYTLCFIGAYRETIIRFVRYSCGKSASVSDIHASSSAT